MVTIEQRENSEKNDTKATSARVEGEDFESSTATVDGGDCEMVDGENSFEKG